MYYVYIVQSIDTSFYVGVTTNLKKVLKEYNTPILGIKFLRARKIVRLVYASEHTDMGQAIEEESKIKSLSYIQKIDFIKSSRKEHLLKIRTKKSESRKDYLKNKEQARKIIVAEVERVNKFYNFKYNKIAIRDQKSRWGSCSQKKNLNFNYRLFKLPSKQLEYVVVHELCHLVELNHGPKFWALVAQYMPDYKAVRAEMKNHGMDFF
ncbi:MAG: YgjP-like metallopeptidase domain-containing protein [Minisyncoccia bacterium]